MKLIIGLGNPGAKYANTRHNVGFMALDHMQDYYGFPPFKKSEKHQALISEGLIGDEKVLLAKPQTFMNLSGEAAASLANFYKINRADTIAIYDEVAIDIGAIRLRGDGSSGGHNGVESLIQRLGGADFLRIRIGIKPSEVFRGALEDYVLGKPDAVQKAAITHCIADIPEVLESLFKKGLEVTMNRFN
jgi:PTH1 family peptidyl-tRNA hydrolase